jgi:hypothetical protein
MGTPRRPKPVGDWLALQLEQPGPNRAAIGAWVEVTAGDQVTVREVTVGGGHGGGQQGWVHFGLGDAPEAQVRVQWPDGEWGQPMTLAANQFALLDRESGQAATWIPET